MLSVCRIDPRHGILDFRGLDQGVRACPEPLFDAFEPRASSMRLVRRCAFALRLRRSHTEQRPHRRYYAVLSTIPDLVQERDISRVSGCALSLPYAESCIAQHALHDCAGQPPVIVGIACPFWKAAISTMHDLIDCGQRRGVRLCPVLSL